MGKRVTEENNVIDITGMFTPQPILSDWFYTVGGVEYHIVMEGAEPCAFHRIMQKWLLGIEWKRREKEFVTP